MSQVATISRVYHDACERLGPDWFEYNTLQVQYNSPDLYEIMRRVGRGKYSEAFQGLHIPSSSNVLIKVLKPVKRSKVKREVKILQNFSNAPRTANIVALLDIVRDPVSKIPSLVTEFIDNDDFRTLYPRLTDREVRYYMFKLLRALDFAHSKGIMHRDVKPHNVMINHAQRKLRLIDWGLAEFYHPGTAYNVRVATRCLKGPELLVGYEYYDYSLDLWSFGCLFAAIIFRKEPFFHGHDNYDQLSRISRVLGTSALWDYLDKYGILLDPAFDNILKESTQKPWLNFVTPVNEHLVCNEAIDLIDSVLKYDHAARLTAREAMDHCYFDPVREQILLEVDSPM